MALSPGRLAVFCAAWAAASAYPVPPAFPAASAIQASGPGPSRPQTLRLLFAFEEYSWAADTAELARRLAFARGLGYNGLVFHLSAIPPGGAGDSVPWTRGPETGCRWRLTGPSGAGRMGARRAFIDRARTFQRVAERAGMLFIPLIGDISWGYQYATIDPGTLAGCYFEMRIPEKPENLFQYPSARAVVSSASGWGDSAGSLARLRSSGDQGTVSLSLRRPGLFAAQWRIDPPWDGYLVWRMPVAAEGAAGDSVTLKAYAWHPGRALHVTSHRLVKEAGARIGPARTEMEAGFYVKRGHVYLIDLEYRTGNPRGGVLKAGPGRLGRAIPPRDDLIDTRGYEAPLRPGQPSCLEYLAAHGHPEEGGMRTLISSRSPPLEEAPWFLLEGPRADSAWASLTAVRGTFRDQSPEARMRLPIDPLAPASRQITAELFDALAEAMGPGTRYAHLGADEVFSLGRSRRQASPAYSRLGPAGLFARIIRDRAAQADSAFAGRHPGISPPTYLIFGDMLSRLNGIEEGTLSALDSLAAAPGMRGRLIIMPWLYPEQLARPLYPRTPGPAGESPEAGFLRVLREDGARFAAAGFDFIGIYSTEGYPTVLREQTQGADAWAKACAERASARSGRCLGLAYAGWDTGPREPWGRNYNGMLLLARNWGGNPALAADSDGDGILDSLRRVDAPR